jgi:hypothetical protein
VMVTAGIKPDAGCSASRVGTRRSMS